MEERRPKTGEDHKERLGLTGTKIKSRLEQKVRMEIMYFKGKMPHFSLILVAKHAIYYICFHFNRVCS